MTFTTPSGRKPVLMSAMKRRPTTSQPAHATAKSCSRKLVCDEGWVGRWVELGGWSRVGGVGWVGGWVVVG